MNPTSDRLRLGILGGTFDPVHHGHITVAEQCAEALGLDRVLLVPCSIPPHRAPTEASPVERLAMVRLAAAGRPRLEVSDIEVRRGGVSYTVDTLRELAGSPAAPELFLLLGWDAAQDLTQWREPGAIAELASIVVFNRSGAAVPDSDHRPLGGLPDGTTVVAVDSPDISATDIRHRVAGGKDASSALHPAVIDYIRAHGLYGHAKA